MRFLYDGTALMLASIGGHAEVIRLLLEHHADVTPTVRGLTALMFAVVFNHYSAVAQLLQGKANVNEIGADGITVLTYAASAGHTPVVQLLLQHQAEGCRQ